MDITTLDILLLFVLAITVSLIIGINVLYMVDKKLSDVRINIPVCQHPATYLKMDNGQIKIIESDCANCSTKPNRQIIYDMGLLKKPTEQNKNKLAINQQTMTRRSNNGQLNNVGGVENFETIAKSSDNVNEQNYVRIDNTDFVTSLLKNVPYKDPNTLTNGSTINNKMVKTIDVNNGGYNRSLLLRQGYNSNASDQPSKDIDNYIMYPRADDVVRYSGIGCYQKPEKQEIRKLTVNENDKTVQQSQQKCRPQVTDNSYNRVVAGMIGANGETDTRDIRFYVPRVYMGEDPQIKGVEYANMYLEIPADVDQIGSIPVNNYDGEPVSIGSSVQF